MHDETPVLHGYYRYTDIAWEWQKVLPEEMITPMKTFIYGDCITAPEHPFHKAGVEGVELFIGTLPNGEVRMLFSSKQIEYLRYWLKAMGLVDTLMPLPSIDCLLTERDLRSISPIVVKSASDIKARHKEIEKSNRRLKGSMDEHLAAVRKVFERVRAAYGSRKGTWIAMDFEWWERSHDIITEFGYCVLEWDQSQPVVTNRGHWVLQENKEYRNGSFVKDGRDEFKEEYGRTETIRRTEFKSRLMDLISKPRPEADGPVYLVFHDCTHDLEILVNPKYGLGILPEKPSLELPQVTAKTGLFAVDTSDLFCALEGDPSSRRSLESVYRRLTHKLEGGFHNAGNDAQYVIAVLKEMASGPPLDLQRNERWPPALAEPGQAAPASVKVTNWQPEDDSDYETTESILGAPLRGRPVEAQ